MFPIGSLPEDSVPINFDDYVASCIKINPPSEYNCPRWIKDASSQFEPKINIVTSLRFLKDYPAEDEPTKEAKKFWLSYKTSPFEDSLKSPKDISDDPEFLLAAEKIRRETWQWHLLVVQED